jgi:tRNA A37 threonylcarbamoyladenosine biosynthesis protein TsaE
MSVGAGAEGFRTIGQEAAQLAVMRAAASGRLQRTLLIHGPAGAGKGTFTDDLLALLFCTDADVGRRPCNQAAGAP